MEPAFTATTRTSDQDLSSTTTGAIYSAICEQIVREQFQIIGTLALEQAGRVKGLQVDPVTFRCVITGDGNTVVEEIISQYRDFFGNAAVEVCKEAASPFISRLPQGALPASLI